MPIYRPYGSKVNLPANLGGHGWRVSNQYTKEVANLFSDNAEGSSKKVTNSVPSPYARMFLFKQAFEYVNSTGKLDGDSPYHYMVSQCLDVLELLFNRNALKTRLEVVRWNISDELDKLSDPKNVAGLQLLGNTMKIYRKQTKLEEFQTSQSVEEEKEALNELFFVLIDGKVVACSSPYTLFFTTDNVLPELSMDLFANPGSRQKPKPLNKRSEDFQDYIYGLSVKYAHIFISNFNGLQNYIALSHETRNLAVDQNQSIIRDYDSNVDAYQIDRNTPVRICNVIIGQKSARKHKQTIENLSDFTIAVDEIFKRYYPEHYIPLALVNNFGYSWIYTDAQHHWQNHYTVDKTQLDTKIVPIQDRVLPYATQYPFVTVEDFLEDNLIRLPFELYESKYICGTFGGDVEKMFLPPIKRAYLDYFNPSTLQKNLRFEADKSDPDIIVVTLDIPLKKGKKISFQKKYYPFDEPNIPEGCGRYYQSDFTLGIFPFYKAKFDTYLNNEYRVMLLHDGNVSLNFYASPDSFAEADQLERKSPMQNLENLVISYQRSRISEFGREVNSTYYKSDINFDVIEIQLINNNQKISALVIPNWPTLELHPATKSYFAIDFGTTNTHIAYRFGDEREPRAFDISEKDMQLAMLNLPNENIPGETIYRRFDELPITGTHSNFYRHEFIPAIVGVPDPKDTRYKFPVRSILAEDKFFGMEGKNQEHLFMLNVNIDFSYGIHAFKEIPNEIKHDIKWSFDNKIENTTRIKAYIRQLLAMVRAKVVRNGLHPRNTEIRWFFPLSISASHRGMLTAEWNKAYRELFNPTGATISINESEAPYYWHRRDLSIRSTNHVLSIDVGGGTSDIVLMHNGEIVQGTSIRFAGNSLFGNGLKKVPGTINGLVKYYCSEFERVNSDRVTPMRIIFRELMDRNLSSEVIANFFFNRPEFEFSRRLIGDKHFKLSLILHFSAMVWYSAQWILVSYKRNPSDKISIPNIIAFSGNGSKLIDIILNGSENYRNSGLNRLVANIFKKVFTGLAFNIPDFIPFIVSKNPKELTCLGGLDGSIEESSTMIPAVFSGSLPNKDDPNYYNLIYNDLKYLTTHRPKASQIEDIDGSELSLASRQALAYDLRINIVDNVFEFIQFFEKQIEVIDFDNAFGASKPVGLNLKEIFSQEKMTEYLYDGIKQMADFGFEPDARLNQTLFFLPLIAGLFDLNEELYKVKNPKTNAK